MFSRDRLVLGGSCSVVGGFVLHRWDVANRGVEPAGVVPVDPRQRGEFEFVDGLERTLPLDAFGLVQADHGLGHRIVVAVADGADGGERAGVGEPFGVSDGRVLWAPASL